LNDDFDFWDGLRASPTREMLKSIPSSPLHAPFFIKLIDFNEKVVSDVTSETTFSLKSIYLMKREDERRMKGACVAPLLQLY
jgi:hypothetical protein